MTPHTTWAVIWSRNLRAHNAVARSNALTALRVVHERRREREEVERFLAERDWDHSESRMSS